LPNVKLTLLIPHRKNSKSEENNYYEGIMLITRWQASAIPTKEQILMMLDLEGLEPTIEVLTANEKILEHRHPYTEVRVIISGEILFNIAGNQFLARAGDRIEIPANTKHWHQNHSELEAVSVYSQRIF
jgi:mannose-6-phosphate isomerase-like protein (cupin superfamily)